MIKLLQHQSYVILACERNNMPILTMSCTYCKKDYVGGIFPSRTTKFCSQKCMADGYKIKETRFCKNCNKEFKDIPSSRIRSCSLRCGGLSSSNCFWKYATEEQKFEKVKELYNKNVIKKVGCWDWKKKKFGAGYGFIQKGRNKSILAHRASWMIHHGPIPDGLWVLHKCDNPTCTNPEHLFLGNRKDNTDDMIKKGRKNPLMGTKHPNVKLLAYQVIEIRQLIKEGISQRQLGKKYKVSPSTIQNIADGKTWKQVKD